MADAAKQQISVTEKDGVIVVRFREAKILEDRVIQQFGGELLDLVQGKPGIKLVIDFTGVKYLSSAALGKLITLRRRVDQVGGRLKLCEIAAEAMDMFRIAKLDEYFDICGDQPNAVAGLK
jgi:anti-sigma B factor antagonist